MKVGRSISKRAIWASGITILLCLAMLGATTFAWFTDVASNTGNKIEAGNLRIKLYRNIETREGVTQVYDPANEYVGPAVRATNTNRWVDISNSEKAVFNLTNWEPGDEYIVWLAVRNGNDELPNDELLNLKYDLDLVLEDATLASVVNYEYYIHGPTTGLPNWAPFTQSGNIAQEIYASGGLGSNHITAVQNSQLDVGEVDYIAVKLSFDTGAGNQYQGKEFVADVQITATQNKAGAVLEDFKVYTAADFANVGPDDTIILMNNITFTGDLEFDHNVNIDTNGYTLTADNITIDVPTTLGVKTVDVDTTSGSIVCGTLTINNPNGTVNLVGTEFNCAVEVTSAPYTLNVRAEIDDLTIKGGSIHPDGGSVVFYEDADIGTLAIDLTPSQAGAKFAINIKNGAVVPAIAANPNYTIIDERTTG